MKSKKIILLELIFYYQIILILFSKYIPTPNVPEYNGLVILFNALFALSLYKTYDIKIPHILYYSSLIFLISFIIGLYHGILPYFHPDILALLKWNCNLIIIYLLIQNNNREDRILIFFAIVFLICYFNFGNLYNITYGIKRLEFSYIKGTFSNPNDLAYSLTIVAIALLYKANKYYSYLKLFILIISIFLLFISLKTVSRGVAIAITICSIIYCYAIYKEKIYNLFFSNKPKSYRNLSFVLFSLFIILILLFNTNIFFSEYKSYKYRIYSQTKRTKLYNLELFNDLKESLLIGKSFHTGNVFYGRTPHNSFIYLFVKFSGICAFLLILIYINLLRNLKYIMNLKIDFYYVCYLISLFSILFILSLLSNKGFLFIPSVFVMCSIYKAYINIH